jgi:succinoglycan biosynthesis protein ExoA
MTDRIASSQSSYENIRSHAVTVIMPIRNEAGYIHDSLLSVLNQDYPREKMEILVVDGMSDDGTRETVLKLQEQYPLIRLINNPGKIVPIGMNIALQQAKGEIIVRVDGHCQIQPDYVSKCVHYLISSDIDGVGGPMETIGETDIAQGIALAMSSPFGVGGSAFRTVKNSTMLVDTVAFPAYRAETIQKNGLYDEELVRNQDDEYNYRLRASGGKILLTPDIRSRYYSRSSLKSLWRQYFQYGYWKVRVMQKHTRQMVWRQFVPPAFVGFLVIFSLMALFSTTAFFLLLLGIAAYIAANLAASAWTAAQYGWRYFPYLVASYAILHFSYGAGFLYGLVKFASRWKAETRRPEARDA